MTMVRLILWSLVVTSFSSFAQQRDSAANVVTEKVSFDAIQIAIETVGTAEAIKSVNLFPAAADKVTAVLFSPGDYVEKGQTLVELDSRRQSNALRRAKIELADAQRRLEQLQKSRQEGAVTQAAVDDAATIRDLAQVNLAEAQVDLDDRSIKAPFSGYVGLTEVEPGDRITLSTLVTTIDDRSQLFINFDAPESAVSLLDRDTRVEVQPWNNRDLLLAANLKELDSRINVQDRTLSVRALLDNKNDRFRPGLSFKVTLSAAGTEYPHIPEAALAWGATGSYVWVAKDGKAQRVPVAIKQRLRGFILVEGQLSRGDTLIVEGIQRLRQGQAVTSSSMSGDK